MGTLIENGLWVDRTSGRQFEGRPAIFLDRDGVLVEEVHFLRRPADAVLTAGIGEAIYAANLRDLPVVLITNQSGIARGYFGWDAFFEVQRRIGQMLALSGAEIDLTLACAYHPEGVGPLARDHAWRKPRPGMLHHAASELGIDIVNSLVVGDRITDLEAGEAAGLNEGILAMTGYGSAEASTLPTIAATWRPSFLVSTAPTAAIGINVWLDASR